MSQVREPFETVAWRDGRVILLDQRKLPFEVCYAEYKTAKNVAVAITDMVVRGAPAIGITAAFGVVLAAQSAYRIAPNDWRNAMREELALLAKARPTAIDLAWALARMARVPIAAREDPVPALLVEAEAILSENIAGNRKMGEFGAELIDGPVGILTHCNAGALATGAYGTALGVVRTAYSHGKLTTVYANETRPWLQGARLTAWELLHDGIPVTLLADGAAASLMQSGAVKWVIVGADRIAKNGDVANKIGTLGLALAARSVGVKFMVVAPTSTIDFSLAGGDAIPIEVRGSEELTHLGGQRVAAKGVECYCPAFDVTPAHLIDVLVTERGIVKAPDLQGLSALGDAGGI